MVQVKSLFKDKTNEGIDKQDSTFQNQSKHYQTRKIDLKSCYKGVFLKKPILIRSQNIKTPSPKQEISV